MIYMSLLLSFVFQIEFETEKKSVILNIYSKSTKQTDKLKALKLVKQFLEKYFYHKHMNLQS
jgi:hypothetical protein